jgi:uncharacterized protein (DUF58 family)
MSTTILNYFFGESAKEGSRLTLVRKRPSMDCSVTGAVYICMMMFMGLAAMNTQASLLFGVLGLMFGIMLVSGVISKMMLRRLRISRELPEAGTVGEPFGMTYRFFNHKKFWPTFSITLAELDGVEGFTRQPQSYMLHAAARESASVPVELFPKRRGIHALNRYQISTSFPFGFFKRAIERDQPDTVVIFPPVARVDPDVLAMAMPAEKTGPTMRPKRGGADELYGLKEYRRGENPRLIYWRRSARTGVLVSREMTQVAPPRLLILVDTYLSRRTRSQHALVETAIAMAGSVATLALEQGLSVGVQAWADGWHGIAPTRGKRHRRDVMTLLARLPVNQSMDAQALLESAQEITEQGTTLMLFTGRNLELGLNEKLRGNMVVISAANAQFTGMFKFNPEVKFDRCWPPDQELGIVED